MSQLATSLICLPIADDYIRVSTYASDFLAPRNPAAPAYEGLADCSAAIRNASADVMVAPRALLVNWAITECCEASEDGCTKPDDVAWASNVAFSERRIGLYMRMDETGTGTPNSQSANFRARQTRLLVALNAVIANYTRTPVYKNLLEAYNVVGDPCDASSDGDADRIDFNQMAGLFMLLGITMGAALLSAIGAHLVFRRQEKQQQVAFGTRQAADDVMDNMPATEGEMLRELLRYARKEKQEAAREAAARARLLEEAAASVVVHSGREVISMSSV